MRAGPLKHRCEVSKPHLESNRSGGATKTWLPVGKVWAEITMPTGRVEPVAEQLTATITAEIRVRPRSDFAAEWRLTERGVTYRGGRAAGQRPDHDAAVVFIGPEPLRCTMKMKIQALGPLSGACGEREKKEIFEVERAYGQGLIARGYAVEIIDKAEKPTKADQAKE